MKRHVLRYVFGVFYVLLLTAMLLYQAGVFGDRRSWDVATLTTLFLGAALAVVLALYMRVNEQIRREDRIEKRGGEPGNDLEQCGRGGAAAKNTVHREAPGTRSYEEIYADFLYACEGRGLSERELEVAWLLYRGRTNRQIGEELFIAETTVKKHVTHIYQKLEVYGRKDFRAMVRAASSLKNENLRASR